MGNNGAATFSIPIAVPPGTAGIAPSLSLVYNSQSQQNWITGVGWGLSGLPKIERCRKTIAQDGGNGAINYDSNDRFCMDGARLVVMNGLAYGSDNAEYRTEVDSGIKIIRTRRETAVPHRSRRTPKTAASWTSAARPIPQSRV